MTRKIDIIGQRYGRWIVLDSAPSDKYQKSRWKARCDCGTEKIVAGTSLTRGLSFSCGCYQREVAHQVQIKHGHQLRGLSSRTYNSWCAMKARCYNQNTRSYKDYGARGIRVCERWLHSFANFLADMGECPFNHTIERSNNNGNYEPGNCEWVTLEVQANNKRSNILIWAGENYVTMAQFARGVGIPYQKFRDLYREKSWPVEKILQIYGGE